MNKWPGVFTLTFVPQNLQEPRVPTVLFQASSTKSLGVLTHRGLFTAPALSPDPALEYLLSSGL